MASTMTSRDFNDLDYMAGYNCHAAFLTRHGLGSKVFSNMPKQWLIGWHTAEQDYKRIVSAIAHYAVYKELPQCKESLREEQ